MPAVTGTTAGPGAVPYPVGDLSHEREPTADRNRPPAFSATVTTDQGRVRSLDHPHLGRERAEAPPAAPGMPGTRCLGKIAGHPGRISPPVSLNHVTGR